MTRSRLATIGLVFVVLLLSTSVADAQRTRSSRPTPTPTRSKGDPEVISRADQYIDENGRVVTPAETPVETPVTLVDPRPDVTAAELDQRLRSLEAGKKLTDDEKARRLALNLDILTKAEQRVESLRKQYFDMVEKEGQIQQRLDTLELDLRPDSIERNVAIAGSLRPEALREARQKTLSAERTKLQALLAEIQRNKANLDTNITRADSLVERLRVKLEKEIDDSLNDDAKPPSDQ
jgi:hypothetical protein